MGDTSKRQLVVVGVASAALGALGATLVMVALEGDASGGPSEVALVTPAPSVAVSDGGQAEGSTGSSGGAEASPPPRAPSPPPTVPPPVPMPPQGPREGAPFPCRVQVVPVPGDTLAARIVVETNADISSAWGRIVSGEQRTAGPIAIVAGRGEQVVPGFNAASSSVTIYSGGRMSPEFKSCSTAE